MILVRNFIELLDPFADPSLELFSGGLSFSLHMSFLLEGAARSFFF